MNQNLILHGLVILLLCWFLKDKVPYIGNLPGDFYLQFGNVQLFLPLASGLLLSLVFSMLRWFFNEH